MPAPNALRSVATRLKSLIASFCAFVPAGDGSIFASLELAYTSPADCSPVAMATPPAQVAHPWTVSVIASRAKGRICPSSFDGFVFHGVVATGGFDA